jgi:hypothetical protein
MGREESGFDACSHAQGLKPNSEEAKSCVAEARKLMAAADATKQAGGG